MKVKERTEDLAALMELWAVVDRGHVPEDVWEQVTKALVGVPRCDDPKCPGWVHDDNGGVQRCDDCKRYKTDRGARVAHGRECERCK